MIRIYLRKSGPAGSYHDEESFLRHQTYRGIQAPGYEDESNYQPRLKE